MRSFIIAVISIFMLVSIAACSAGEPVTQPAAVPAENTDISVKVTGMEAVTAAFYLQMPNLDITFVDFDITNNGRSPVRIVAESEIEGYSERAVNTIDVRPGETVTVGQTPPLKTEKIPGEIKNAMLHYKVTTSSGTVIEEQAVPIKIYAKDTMIWAIEEGDDWTDTSMFIAAFVTPNAAEINDLVRKAAEYHEEKSMTGYQCGDCSDEQWDSYTQEQVKAIYEALQNDYRIKYINSTIAFSNKSDAPQRVRLPAESIRSSSANCIDGAVLYASAFENLGIQSYIVLVPSHAFVGYLTKPDDESSIRFLETTMTASASFEDATDTGNDEWAEENSNGNLQSGKSTLYSIEKLRQSGIHPMQ